MRAKPTPRPVRPVRERRRALRVELLGEISGQSLSFDSPVTVLDLSTGGFRIETLAPLPLGETHEFRFALRDGVSVIVLARVVHQQAASRRPSGTHIVGLEFLDKSAKAKADRAALVNRILTGPVKKRAG